MNLKLQNIIASSVVIILFMLLPPFHAAITPLGMRVLGIFIGTLYLWITEGSLWPSLLCVALLCFSGFGSADGSPAPVKVLTSFFGNSTMMLLFFMMLLAEALDICGVTMIIARKILGIRFLQGRPWRTVAAVSIASFLLSIFINPFTPIFLFWPILEEMFRVTGYNRDYGTYKENLLPKLMLVLVVAAAVIGYAVPGYYGTPLVLINNFAAMAEGREAIATGSYFVSTFITGLIMVIVAVLAAKLVFRPDASKMEAFVPEKDSCSFDLRQKLISGGFILMIILMLVPALLPQSSPVIKLLASSSAVMPLVITALLAMIPLKDGPVLNVQKALTGRFNWSSYFLCGAAIMIGNALTDPNAGISAALQESLAPAFTGMAPAAFLIIMCLVCFIITNFCNSLVVMMIAMPLIRAFCNVNSVSGVSMTVVIMMITLMTALFTPAASPFAAVLHGNVKWLRRSEIYRFTAVICCAEATVIMTIGILLSRMFNT